MKRWVVFAPVAAYAGAIFVLSHQSQLPAPPGGDKLAHFVTFAGLAVLSVRALYYGTVWPQSTVILGAALFTTLYGMFDELHQSFVPGRSAAIEDAVADAAGALCGATVALLVYRRNRRAR